MTAVRILVVGLAVVALVVIAGSALRAGVMLDSEQTIDIGPAAAQTVVPEPATLAFIGLGSVAVMAMRRRRKD